MHLNWGSDGFKGMDLHQAKQIRAWRVDYGATWRSLAELASDEWHGDWGSNQIAGMELCEAAAALLGEDPNTAPWN